MPNEVRYFLLFILAVSVFICAFAGILAFLGRLCSSGNQESAEVFLEPHAGGFPQLPADDGRFSVRFFLPSVIFILFSAAALIFLLWVVCCRETGETGFRQALCFSGFCLCAGMYVYKKGVFH